LEPEQKFIDIHSDGKNENEPADQGFAFFVGEESMGSLVETLRLRGETTVGRGGLRTLME
jgi:hypothetical protein